MKNEMKLQYYIFPKYIYISWKNYYNIVPIFYLMNGLLIYVIYLYKYIIFENIIYTLWYTLLF